MRFSLHSVAHLTTHTPVVSMLQQKFIRVHDATLHCRKHRVRLTDSMGTITEQEQEFITDNALGLWWVDAEERFLYEPVLDPEEALIEKITEKTGWCIKSIKFCENRPHRLTAFK